MDTRTIKQALQSKFQHKEIEKNTFLIWFGPEVPQAVEVETGGCGHEKENYLENVFLHKEFNPDITVHLIVRKRLMEESYFSWLKNECEKNKVILVDFDEEYKDILNRDLVEKFLENKKDYVCASDVLRLSLLFHLGGRYFDTDLKLLNDYYCLNYGSKKGFPLPQHQKYGFTFFLSTEGDSLEFHALESAKEHPLFLWFLAASRYLSLKLLEIKDNYPLLATSFSKEIRSRLVMMTTGGVINEFYKKINPISEMMKETAIGNFEQFIFNQYDNHHHTWLSESFCGEDYRNLFDKVSEEEYEQYEKFISNFVKEIGEDKITFFYQKALEYFPQHGATLNELYPLLIQKDNESDKITLPLESTSSVPPLVATSEKGKFSSEEKLNQAKSVLANLSEQSLFNKKIDFSKIKIYLDHQSNKLIFDYSQTGIDRTYFQFRSFPSSCKTFIQLDANSPYQITISTSDDVLGKINKRHGFYFAKNGEIAIAFPSENERNEVLNILKIDQLGFIGNQAQHNQDNVDRSNTFYMKWNHPEKNECLVM